MPELLVPHDAQHGILVLKLPQLRKRRACVNAIGEVDAVGHHRLQNGRSTLAFAAEPLPRGSLRQALNGAYGARCRLIDGFELCARVNADARDLFAVYLVTVFKAAAGNFHAGKSGALRITQNFEHSCAKGIAVLRLHGVVLKEVNKLAHAVKFKSRAEQHGKELSFGNHACDIAVGNTACLHVAFKRLLVAHCGGLAPSRIVLCRKIDAVIRQMLLYILEYALFIRTREIHLRCENYRRDAVLSQKPPERFRVCLNAVGSGNDEHGVVKHLQGALGLGGKIHMSRRVKQAQLDLVGFKLRLL